MGHRAIQTSPGGRHPKVLSTLLRSYLVLFLSGCAGTRPLPTIEEARAMETRTLELDEERAFDAVVTALQDLDYSIDATEREAGLISASRETHVELAEISEDRMPGEKEGLPTWAKVALVATGVIVIVAVVAAVSGDDDDERSREGNGGEHRNAPERRCRRHHHHHDSGPDVVVVEHDDSPSGPPIYSYQITVNLKALSETQTAIRVSGRGTLSQGGTIRKAGPVYDPAFFESFFASVGGANRVSSRSAI
jgi:hypothetical protein